MVTGNVELPVVGGAVEIDDPGGWLVVDSVDRARRLVVGEFITQRSPGCELIGRTIEFGVDRILNAITSAKLCGHATRQPGDT